MIGSVQLKRAGILFGIFLLSVIIRIPNLNRPLSKHHEFCTALVLQIYDVWEKEGIETFNYNPATNYHREADKGINNWSSSTHNVKDRAGNYYYISHPPLAYYLPYFTFKLIGIEPGVLPLQLFNIFMHFVSALLIYILVSTILLGTYDKNRHVTAGIAFTLYLFAPSTLWFQSNVYMSDMLVIVFFLSAITSLLAWEKFRKNWMAFGFLISTFLAVYTSWLGVFMIVGISLYWFLKERRNKKLLALCLGAWSASLLALLATFYQYSQIAGSDVYVEQMIERYQERGSLKGSSFLAFTKTKLLEIIQILQNYLTGFLPLILIVITWLFGKRIFKPLRAVQFSQSIKRFFWLAGLPVLLLHLVLLNYSGHDFVQLYGAPFLSVYVALLLSELVYAGKLSVQSRNISLVFILSLSIGLYFYVNRPGELSWKGDRYAVQKELGEVIRSTASDDQVVFVQGLLPEPQLIYYAKRNIISVTSLKEAREVLTSRKEKKGIIYFIDADRIQRKESFVQ